MLRRALSALVMLLVLSAGSVGAQGYVNFYGLSLHELNTDTRLGKLPGRNFGLWFEGTEEREIFIQMGTDGLFPLLAGEKLDAGADKRNGLLMSGYTTADMSIFTWRQGANTRIRTEGGDLYWINAFAMDWRHVSRPVTGDRNENFFSLGWMMGVFSDGDELKDMDFIPSEMKSKLPDEMTLSLKAGYEFVLTERGSRNIWTELNINYPLNDEIGIMVMPNYARRKLLAYDVVKTTHEHRIFSTFGLKVGFYIYVD
jgi:hypothetical protein